MHVQEIHLLCWLTNNVLNTNVMRVENIFSLNKAFFCSCYTHVERISGCNDTDLLCPLIVQSRWYVSLSQILCFLFQGAETFGQAEVLGVIIHSNFEWLIIKSFKIRNCLLCPRIFFINWDRQGHSLPKLYVYMYMYFCIPMYDNVWCQSCVHINVDACCV